MVSEISVIIPAYNRADLIGETLWSLLNQTLPAKEIIVVDDGSTDGTAEAVERVFSVFREECSRNSKSNIKNPTLKILHQRNAGPGAARNRGVAEASGDFIHFFDSDDIAAPNKHEVQLRALLETGADIAYGPWVKGRFVNSITNDTNGHEKVEELLTTDDTDKHGYQKNQHGNAQGTCAGAAFSNPFTSEPARNSENTSPTRSATGPVGALFADQGEIRSAGENQLAASKEFLEGQSQAGLQMDSQKLPTIRTANDPSASGEYSSALIRDIRGQNADALYAGPGNFVPEGPVLQAKGLPKGSLIKALLTNWSIVPHACLFRTSIVKKVGGFAEESFGYEDQFMFLRCLLAGAKVVHTPDTLELYRVDNPGKLTEAGESQKKFALECARFLLQAKDEVERREWFTYHPPNTITVSSSEKTLKLDSPVQWFGYRLRVYEAWQDLEKFFPGEKSELKENLQRIVLPMKKNRKVDMLIYKAAGFLIRKFGGLKQRILGHRWSVAYRCKSLSKQTAVGCGLPMAAPPE